MSCKVNWQTNCQQTFTGGINIDGDARSPMCSAERIQWKTVETGSSPVFSTYFSAMPVSVNSDSGIFI